MLELRNIFAEVDTNLPHVFFYDVNSVLEALSDGVAPQRFHIETVRLQKATKCWYLNNRTLVGKIMNATTVTSEPAAFSKWFSRARDSMKISAPLLVNSYLGICNLFCEHIYHSDCRSTCQQWRDRVCGPGWSRGGRGSDRVRTRLSSPCRRRADSEKYWSSTTTLVAQKQLTPNLELVQIALNVETIWSNQVRLSLHKVGCLQLEYFVLLQIFWECAATSTLVISDTVVKMCAKCAPALSMQ